MLQLGEWPVCHILIVPFVKGIVDGKRKAHIDLRIYEFHAEYVGKMNLDLSLLDKLEKRENENPSIGIILCAEKDNVEVELALDGLSKPTGVADYKLPQLGAVLMRRHLYHQYFYLSIVR